MGCVFRDWRANTRKRFNLFGRSLRGPAQVERWLIFGGHLSRMGDAMIMKQVLHFRSFARLSLVGDRGGGRNPLWHCGRGVRPCVLKKSSAGEYHVARFRAATAAHQLDSARSGQRVLEKSGGQICDVLGRRSGIEGGGVLQVRPK